MCGLRYDPDVFSHNKVAVFNLGFDRKGLEAVHWIYYPQKELSFYRVEVGLPGEAELEADDWGALKARVLADLQTCGVVDDQTLVASHEVLLDPAYVHITMRSDAEAAAKRTLLAEQNVHSIGRYGGWTYCSIEDNIVEARALAGRLTTTS